MRTRTFSGFAAILGVLLVITMAARCAIAVLHHFSDASAVASAAPRVATTPAIEAGRGNLASTR